MDVVFGGFMAHNSGLRLVWLVGLDRDYEVAGGNHLVAHVARFDLIEKAFLKLETDTPNLVVIRHDMSRSEDVAEGIGLLREIRKHRRPKIRDVPVFFLVNPDEDRVVTEAMELGVEVCASPATLTPGKLAADIWLWSKYPELVRSRYQNANGIHLRGATARTEQVREAVL
jgi:PleD family two-component response regulator